MSVSKKINTALVAGLTAAVLDMTGAIVVYSLILKLRSAQWIMQSVAAGAYGKKAFEGGRPMAFAGLAFHFFIALCFAFFYMLIYPYWKKFFNNPMIAGLCYGCIVWSVMNLIVLPITGKPAHFDPKYTLISLLIIIVCVGLPIAIITDKRTVRA